jgi:hypothetical protein
MRVDNETGIRNLCEVALLIKKTMPVNAATKFAIRTVLREAINKSNKEYKGNSNRKNCRYISPSAEEELTHNPNASLIADHAIPVSRSLRKFEELKDSTFEEIINIVSKYTVMVLITQSEDKQLSNAGLVRSMPTDWDGIYVYARYKHIGINVKPNKSFKPTPESGAV